MTNENKPSLIPKSQSNHDHTHMYSPSGKSTIYHRLKIIGIGLLSCVVLGIIGICAILWIWGKDLPDFSVLKTYEPQISSRVYTGDGKLIAQYAKQRRIFMPIETLPERVKHAFISAEDGNFYNHVGLDFFALMRAGLSNILRYVDGRRPIGASTITQQVAKNFFLTNERTISRKAKEAILAVRIEEALTKDRILELYLNEIYLGRGAYGIAAASMRYFSTPPSSLTLAQTAYLAALPKAPNNYHPIYKKDAAITRRNWVLKRMWEEGYISASDMKSAQTEPLNAMQGTDPNIVEADYFLEETRREVYKKFGETGLYENGLSIHTTLNSDYQKYAHKALRKALLSYDMRHGYRGPLVNLAKFDDPLKRFKAIKKQAGTIHWQQALITSVSERSATAVLKNGEKILLPFNTVSWARKYFPIRAGELPQTVGEVLSQYDVILLEDITSVADKSKGKRTYILRQVPKVNGGIIAIDPHTGRVLAMVGGWDFSLSKFNRATQAKRQPGSSIKPFVYLSALTNGETPATTVIDAPFVLTLENGEKWKPQNFSKRFFGTNTIRTGIERSRNLMTIRLAQKVGITNIMNTFKKFNIMDNPRPLLSYTLGAGETTLIKMITGYSILINGGKKITPSLIDRIQNRYGKVIYKHINQPCDTCNVLSDKMPKLIDNRKTMVNAINAYQIVTMMEGVVERGTGRELREFKIPMTGKTGTTNDGKDAWFFGATPDLVVGTYIGFDSPKSLGKRPPGKMYNWWTQEVGQSVALPAVKEFYRQAIKDLPAVPFRIPQGVRMVRIDQKTGRIANSKTKKSRLEAFIPGTEPKEDDNAIITNSPQKSTDAIGIQDLY